MDNLRTFRVPVILKKKTVEVGRYLILVTCTESGKVRELQDHIKSVFNLSGHVKLKVENFLLPANESIRLVHPEDVIEVEEDESVDDHKGTIQQIKSERRKNLTGLGAVLNQMLEEKRNELLSNLGSATCALPAEVEPISIVINNCTNNGQTSAQESAEESYDCENSQVEEKVIVKRKFNDVEDSAGQEFFSTPEEHKRRRRRTRKKKTNPLSELPSNDDSFELNSSMYSESFSKPLKPLLSQNGKPKKKHIYFNNDGEPDLEPELNTVAGLDQTDPNDWKDRLLQLASLPKENKVFHRSMEPNGKLDNSSDLYFACLKAGNVLIFKVLVMVNSCPVVSPEITGEIVTINQEDESLSLNILKNSEVLMNMEDDDINLNEFNIKWARMIEPRLSSSDHIS